MLRGPVVLAVLVASGCAREIVVAQCDRHDATTPADAASTPTDSGASDGGSPTDVGGGCGASSLCLRGVTPSATVIDIGERLAVIPIIDNPHRATLAWRVDASEIWGERRAGRPPVVFAELTFDFSISNAGEASFVVTQVPPWFIETRLALPIHVREAPDGEEQTVHAEVLLRGNTVYTGTQGGGVYALASNGSPAGSGMGELVRLLSVNPRALELLSDGTLLVFDEGLSPRRLRRFRLVGTDVLINEFQTMRTGVEPVFRPSADLVWGMAELPDGRIVVAEHQSAGASTAPKSRLVVFAADGTYQRDVWATTANEYFIDVTVARDGSVLVADRGTGPGDGRISRYDPSSWMPLTPLLDVLPGTVWSVQALESGDVYVSGDAFMLQLPAAGGQAAVTGLPAGSEAFRTLAPFEGGRLLFSRAVQASMDNLGIIDGRRFAKWLRTAATPGSVTSIRGVAYLR